MLVGSSVIDRVSTVALIVVLAVAIFLGAFGAEKPVERGLVIVALCWDRGSTLLVIRNLIIVVHGATAEAGQGVELYSFLRGRH